MEIGRQRAVILSNSIETITTKAGDKPAVVLKVGIGDDEGRVTIWLTDKALGIARKHLKTCGFDPDTEDFGVLLEDPSHLNGKEVDVIVEEKNGYMNISLPLGNAAPVAKEDISRIGGLLKKKPKGDDAPGLDDIPFALIATMLPALGMLGA